MTITTDRTINIISGGSFDIGVSKSLNNYTFDDLWDNAYAGVTATDLKHICDTYTSTAIGKGHEGESPLNYLSEDNNYVYVSNGTMSYQKPEGYYCKIILLYSDTYHNKSFTKFDNNVFVITSCNMQNIVYTTTGYISNTTPDFPRRPDFGDIKHINDTKTETKSLNGYIIPALLIKYNDTGYVYALLQKNSITYFDYSMSMMNPASVQGYEWGEQMLPYDGDSAKGVAHGLNVDFNEVSPKFYKSYHSVDRFSGCFVSEDKDINAYVQSVADGHGGIIYRANTITKLNEWLSYFGMLFFSDKFYKPVIQNGVITGYTDDMATDSEFDSYTGNTQHEVPDKPPLPPDKDDIEPMIYGVNAGLYGAVTYYTMTYVQLSSFMDALETATIEHPDIASGFVSAYYIPKVLDDITHSTEMPVRVKGVELSGATGGKTILQKSIVLGTIYVPVRHNNAFDTLTKYFLYTPYTDVIQLNYKCYGKTLTIIMLPALQDCTASIIVQCDGMTIAKQTVSLGSSLAIAVENNSEKSTAIVNACSKYLASAGGVIGGAVTGDPRAVAGGAIGVVASTVNVLNAIGNTYIHSYGTTTGTSLALNPQNIYLIEYIVKTDKPDNFASTVGNLCNKELTLSENMGYTVCDNPKVYGTMTLVERTEIENYLRAGVIL